MPVCCDLSWRNRMATKAAAAPGRAWSLWGWPQGNHLTSKLILYSKTLKLCAKNENSPLWCWKLGWIIIVCKPLLEHHSKKMLNLFQNLKKQLKKHMYVLFVSWNLHCSCWAERIWASTQSEVGAQAWLHVQYCLFKLICDLRASEDVDYAGWVVWSHFILSSVFF